MKLNSKKTIFAKLYPYYCRKLLGKLPLIFINLLFIVAFVSVQIWLKNKFGLNYSPFGRSESSDINSLTKLLKEVLFLSLNSFYLIFMIGNILATGLVGGYGGGQIKFIPTKESSRGEDIKTLLFTPRITRKNVVWAKFVAVFTYCFSSSFVLTTLPFAIYFATASKISLTYLLFFLIFHGLILNLVYNLLLIPALFYVNASGSLFLTIIFGLSFSLLGGIGYYFFKDFILQNLFLVSILFAIVFLLVGSLFFLLWEKDFLRKDLV